MRAASSVHDTFHDHRPTRRRASTPVSPGPAGLPDGTARRLQKLQRLSDIGMELAELVQARIHRATAEDAEPQAITQLNLTYQRLARAVGQTVALEARLELEHRIGAKYGAEKAARQTATGKRCARITRRDEIRKLVEDSVKVDKAIKDKYTVLQDVHEYFEESEIDFLDLSRAIGQIAADICADLGIDPDYKSWDDATSGYVNDWEDDPEEPLEPVTPPANPPVESG